MSERVVLKPTEKHVYSDGDRLHISETLSWAVINSRLSDDETLLFTHLLATGRLDSPEEMATALGCNVKTIKKAINKLKKTEILDKVLSRGEWSEIPHLNDP